MPYTDKNGKVWPDTLNQNGVNLILDPVASMAAKRPKYRPDPRERQEYAYKYGFAEKPEEPPSALEGLAMTGAGAAALVGGQKLGSYLGSSAAGETAKTGLSQVGQNALAGNVSAPGAAIPAPTGVGLSEAAPVAAEAPGMFALEGIGSAGNLLLPAIGAYGAYDLYSSNRGANNRPAGALQGMASGAAMGSYYGAPGAIVGGVLGGIYGGTQHESTRDATARRTQDLLKKSSDPVYQSYVQGMREQYKEAPKGPAYAGQYNTFDEYKKAGLQANDLTGVYGNINTFGEDWAKLDEAKRQEVTQALINANLYDSKKGDVVITDKEKAKAIFQGLVGGNQPALTNLASNAAAIQRPVANSNQAFRR